jgi:hypothetical protein
VGLCQTSLHELYDRINVAAMQKKQRRETRTYREQDSNTKCFSFGSEKTFLFVEVIQGGAEKWENLKLTMRFRPAVKILLHT